MMFSKLRALMALPCTGLLFVSASVLAGQSPSGTRDLGDPWLEVNCEWNMTGSAINLAVPDILARKSIILDRPTTDVPTASCRRLTAGPQLPGHVVGHVFNSAWVGVPADRVRLGARIEGVDRWADGADREEFSTQLHYVIPACTNVAACPAVQVPVLANLLMRKETEAGESIGTIGLSNLPVFELFLASADESKVAVFATYITPTLLLNPTASTCTWDKTNVNLALGTIDPGSMPAIGDISTPSPVGVLTSQGCQAGIGNVKIWMNGASSSPGLFDTQANMGAAIALQMRNGGSWMSLSPNSPYDNAPPASGVRWEFQAMLVRTAATMNPGAIDVPITMVIGYE